MSEPVLNVRPAGFQSLRSRATTMPLKVDTSASSGVSSLTQRSPRRMSSSVSFMVSARLTISYLRPGSLTTVGKAPMSVSFASYMSFASASGVPRFHSRTWRG